jgi:hypothetical protein
MKHQLEPGQTIPVKVNAIDKFSTDTLQVQPGEQYQFSCDDQQFWTDWYIRSSPDGYFNALGWIAGMRVKKVKCFCLCGIYDQDETSGFAIGSNKLINVTRAGEISFFPNDVSWAYGNNKGQITVSILRK